MSDICVGSNDIRFNTNRNPCLTIPLLGCLKQYHTHILLSSTYLDNVSDTWVGSSDLRFNTNRNPCLTIPLLGCLKQYLTHVLLASTYLDNVSDIWVGSSDIRLNTNRNPCFTIPLLGCLKQNLSMSGKIVFWKENDQFLRCILLMKWHTQAFYFFPDNLYFMLVNPFIPTMLFYKYKDNSIDYSVL